MLPFILIMGLCVPEKAELATASDIGKKNNKTTPKQQCRKKYPAGKHNLNELHKHDASQKSRLGKKEG